MAVGSDKRNPQMDHGAELSRRVFLRSVAGPKLPKWEGASACERLRLRLFLVGGSRSTRLLGSLTDHGIVQASLGNLAIAGGNPCPMRHFVDCARSDGDFLGLMGQFQIFLDPGILAHETSAALKNTPLESYVSRSSLDFEI